MSVPNVKRRINAAALRRRRIVAVIGSGQTADPHCGEVGRLVATLGFDLLTGGGRAVMAEVSRAFFEVSPRRGLVIGVVPATVEPIEALEDQQPHEIEYELPPGYPNEWVEIAIYTHLPASGADGASRSSRNHINVLSCEAIVALPGGPGTAAEVSLAVQYGKPVVVFSPDQALVDHFPKDAPRVASVEDVARFLQRHLERSR